MAKPGNGSMHVKSEAYMISYLKDLWNNMLCVPIERALCSVSYLKKTNMWGDHERARGSELSWW